MNTISVGMTVDTVSVQVTVRVSVDPVFAGDFTGDGVASWGGRNRTVNDFAAF